MNALLNDIKVASGKNIVATGKTIQVITRRSTNC